jgi:SAM-dependent methyltransferase
MISRQGVPVMRKSINYPDFVARFYDVVYRQIRSHVDETYFLQQIAKCRGRVLEIGVGTGRLFSQALNLGADIYGLDVSGNMIEKAKEKIPSEYHHRLWIQNAVTMQLPYKFALILAPFRVFAHLIDFEDQIDCLNRINDHLEPGGRFIFDMFIPDLNVLANGRPDQVDFEGEYEMGKKLIRITSANYDLPRQIANVQMRFRWDEDGMEQEAVWNFPMRFYFRFELEHLIRLSNLELESIYGDYQEKAIDKDSKDFVLICRRNR